MNTKEQTLKRLIHSQQNTIEILRDNVAILTNSLRIKTYECNEALSELEKCKK